MMTEFQTQYGTIKWFAVLSIHLNQGSRKVKNLEVCTIIKGRAESDPLVDGIGLTDLPKIGGANGTLAPPVPALVLNYQCYKPGMATGTSIFLQFS